jgi:hypothetical protein
MIAALALAVLVIGSQTAWADQVPVDMLICEESGGTYDWCAVQGPVDMCLPGCICEDGSIIPGEEILETGVACGDTKPPNPGAALCAETGGTWTDCGSGCGPMNCEMYVDPPDACLAVCVELCQCPEDTPIWTENGCTSADICGGEDPNPDVALCAQTGGSWTGCGSGCGPMDCDMYADPPDGCDAVCVALCECSEDAPIWTEFGCVSAEVCEEDPKPEAPEMVLCDDSGGTWTDCGSGCGPTDCDLFMNPPDGCPEECLELCECPDDAPIWTETGCTSADICDGNIQNPDIALCAETGGAWTDCGSGCGPMNCDLYLSPAALECPEICVDLCECPDDTPIWTEDGCTSADICDGSPPSEQEICEGSGGTWDECATSSCPGCDDCVGGCFCGGGQGYDPRTGCFDVPSMEELCVQSGGSVECGDPPAADEGDPLPPNTDEGAGEECFLVCACPEGQVFDDTGGCVDDAELSSEVLCRNTGGTWDSCASACPEEGPEDQACPDVCLEVCACPAGQVFDDGEGCVDVPVMEEICEQTGGTVECFSDCDEGEDCEAVCFPTCVCPDSQTFDILEGCIDGSGETGGESGEETGGGSGGGSGGGCAVHAGPASGGMLWLLAMCAGWALARRTRERWIS